MPVRAVRFQQLGILTADVKMRFCARAHRRDKRGAVFCDLRVCVSAKKNLKEYVNALEVAEGLLEVVVEPLGAHGVEEQEPHEDVARLLPHRQARRRHVGRRHAVHQIVP